MDVKINQKCNLNSSLNFDSSVSRLHSAAVPIVQQSTNVRVIEKNCKGSTNSLLSQRFSGASSSSGDTDIHYIKASELFPKKVSWVEGGLANNSDPPFPLLPGEDILYEGRTSEGSIYVSSYRLYVNKTSITDSTSGYSYSSRVSKEVNVPLGLIETLECKDICFLNVYCKDTRSFRLTFLNGESCQDWLKRLSLAVVLPRKAEDVFSLAFYAWTRDNENNVENPPNLNQVFQPPWWRKKPTGVFLTGEQLFRFEVERQGYDTAVTWRVTTANVEFKLSSSYPTHLLVPTSISDDMLETVAAFRSAHRLPAVVWRNRRNGAVLCRCSQPEVGWLGWRSQEDENLLLSILNSCIYDSAQNGLHARQSPSSPETTTYPSEEWNAEAGLSCSNGSSGNIECGSLKDLSEDSSCFNQTKKMLIIDARSYATAVANRARGGGCEFPQYYPHCDIEFMNLANIHAVRKSFLLLRSLCVSYNGNFPTYDQSNWFTQLDSTRWLHHIANLMRAACYTASNLEEQGRPVIVHCSDGWDRTPQIVSLAQLIIDPFYRTMRGFQILVQREWLEFGHKFADRCGLFGGCEDTNERCPVFLQFLDCLHQLLNQFPTAFEFNHSYLVKMVQHVYSNLFGTFLLNTEQERTVHRIAERSHSLWDFLDAKSNEFYNYLYSFSEEPLWPSYQIRDLKFWSEVYSAELGSRMSAACEIDGCHASVSITSSKSTSNSPCSSGYATPRQTALTDSMIDALALKNLVVNDLPRTIMEDSTDTLVDDAPKLSSVVNCVDSELDCNDSFPLLESEETMNSLIWSSSLKQKGQEHSLRSGNSIDTTHGSLNTSANQVTPGLVNAVLLKEEIPYKGDCPTCQRNWNFLNRREEKSKELVDSDTSKLNPSSFDCTAISAPRCLKFDLDGLIPTVDRLQARLRQILHAKELELEALRRDLHQTRVALCHQVCHTCQSNKQASSSTVCTKSESGRPTGLGPPSLHPEQSDDSSNETNASSAAWVTVDTKEFDKATVAQPILWVPDHLAPTCMKCGAPFWMGRRRHHCRNCGEVFCAECTNRGLPLPHQNLLYPARVCDACYSNLNGQDSTAILPSTLDHDRESTISHTRQQPRERAFSLTNLYTGNCFCPCCRSRRSSKLEAVTAAST